MSNTLARVHSALRYFSPGVCFVHGENSRLPQKNQVFCKPRERQSATGYWREQRRLLQVSFYWENVVYNVLPCVVRNSVPGFSNRPSLCTSSIPCLCSRHLGNVVTFSTNPK